MDGLIVLNKPIGRTSHDMIYSLRRLTGEKKIGHTGTLDPDATGVLPICIGRATRACDKLTASDKAYRAQLVLGMTTDTQDASGEILTQQPVDVTYEEFCAAAESFVGRIQQIPPMYSALKRDGKKLCDLARAGITIEREARPVTIYDIRVLEFSGELATIEVSCSKGTYIRTLCEDIGMKLGCGAYMNTLCRTKSGGFSIEESYTLDELNALKAEGKLEDAIIPVDKLFSAYPEIYVEEYIAKLIRNGVRVKKLKLDEGKTYRVYEKNGAFIALSTYMDGELVLEKAFW